MKGGETWAVVPVKPFHLAKQRLAAILDERDRIGLARVMLADVLSALDACSHRLAGVMVVTADEEASVIARQHDALVFSEAEAIGLNEALGRVVHHLTGRADTGMIVVPADLPHVSPGDLSAMIDLVRCPPAIALVRANDGGTNLLACRPVRAIAPAFGPDSFNTHCALAVRSGITPTVRLAPHLQLDVDRPDDLVAFVSLESATRTHRYLSKLNVRQRLRDQTRRTSRPGASDRGREGVR